MVVGLAGDLAVQRDQPGLVARFEVLGDTRGVREDRVGRGVVCSARVAWSIWVFWARRLTDERDADARAMLRIRLNITLARCEFGRSVAKATVPSGTKMKPRPRPGISPLSTSGRR